MTNILTEGDEAKRSTLQQPTRPALAMASATLRYSLAGEDHYFPVPRLSVCTIGRSNANNICFDDRLISRDHATIGCSATGACELTDLGSSNGTRVNGRLIDGPVILKDGDTIQLGQQLVDFIQSGTAAELVTRAGEEGSVAIYPPHSLITVLSINIRGYAGLGQMLGEAQRTQLMADVGQVAEAVFARRGAWKTNLQGSAVNIIWAHHHDEITAHELLNIIDAVSEMRIGLRPLQKRYHLLRPVIFGAGLTTGHALLADVEPAGGGDFGALCQVVQQAYQLEIATHATGCDMLIAQNALAHLPQDLAHDRLPPLCTVSLRDMPEMPRTYAVQFDGLGALSATLAECATPADNG